MPIIWIVHKDVTLDNMYHVNYGYDNRFSKVRCFKKLEKAKAFAKVKAKTIGAKEIIYHDSNETLHKIKVE